MKQERIDIERMEAQIRLWREGDISDEALALDIALMSVMDMVPELKRCYERLDVYREELEYQLHTAKQCGWTETIERLHLILNASE
tara:strand:- start:604 stop:861 length:258 start_codon:yes stop_codon:yes gene_type:complete